MNRPRFRTDLVTSPTTENGNRFVDVTDPDSGKTFRFYEVEYAVATAMNGERDVGALVDWAREELGLQPSAEEVETVVSTLDALGYLGAGDVKAAAVAPKTGADLDISDLSLGAPGKSPIRADERRRREASNIDLGSAGRSPRATPREDLPKPASADVELGAAGGTDEEDEPMTGAPPAPPPLDLNPPQAFASAATDPKRTLMGTGALSMDPGADHTTPAPRGNVPADTDLSVDLGQHINIGTDDVKEAVRASKVMSVPEMPAGYGGNPAQVRAPRVPQPGSTPIELPGRPPASAVANVPPPPPVSTGKRGTSVVTIILFVVLLAAVAGAVYYFGFYAAEKENLEKKTTTVIKPKNSAPASPVGMVRKGEVKNIAVKSPRAGRIAWLIAPDAVVEEGDPVAKFDGFQSKETKITEALASKKRHQTRLDKATAAGNKSSMKAAEADVKRKEGQIAGYVEELGELTVKAPTGGVATLVIENGARVVADAELVKIKSETWPTADFTLSEEGKYKVGDKIEAVVKSDPSKTALCEVTEAEAKRVSIKCPPESGLAENAALTLR